MSLFTFLDRWGQIFKICKIGLKIIEYKKTMFNHFLNSQTKTITFAAILLAISVLISRVLGLIRDRLLAGSFGAGEELDIYFAAFRIPDFVYGILIMGGISAVFLPIFSEYFKKNEKEAWEFTNNLLNSFLILLVLICGILFIFTPFLIDLIAPGFSQKNQELTVSLARIMFLSPIFFGLSSIFSGVLHYFNRFLAYSIAPVLYNLGIIFGILFLVPKFGLHGLAYGVILGAISHWVLQIPAARSSGYKYLPVVSFKSPGLIKAFKLMIPRTIGAAAYHINLIVVTAIASTLAVGSISIFNFSNNLQYFPIGLIGLSFALASFPVLTRAWTAGLKDKFLETFYSTFCQVLFLIVPISILIFILRTQIVKVILGTGRFGWSEIHLTAASLGIFCLGIFSAAFIPFLARVFYSFQDTKTPVLIGISSMALNIILCFTLVFFLKSSALFQDLIIKVLNLQGIDDITVLGLPLALSIAAVIQFLLLLIFLKKKLAGFGFKEIWISFQKIIVASILMTVSVYFTLQLIANFININAPLGILIQGFFAALIGMLVYILTAYFLRSPEISVIKSAILKQFNGKNSEF